MKCCSYEYEHTHPKMTKLQEIAAEFRKEFSTKPFGGKDPAQQAEDYFTAFLIKSCKEYALSVVPDVQVEYCDNHEYCGEECCMGHCCTIGFDSCREQILKNIEE